MSQITAPESEAAAPAEGHPSAEGAEAASAGPPTPAVEGADPAAEAAEAAEAAGEGGGEGSGEAGAPGEEDEAGEEAEEGEPGEEAEGDVAAAPPELADEVRVTEAPDPGDEGAAQDEAAEGEAGGVEERPIVHRHFVAPALIALDRVEDDATFRVRPAADLDDVSALATDVARLGQLFPIDVRLKPPDRFQVITGFRRVAALRFLQREKVLARLHTDLGDDDAMLMALAAAIHARAVDADALAAVRARLEEAGRLTPAARDMLDKALSGGDELAPESVEEEVDADELANDVTVRLGEINQDLSLLADVFADLDDERRDALLTQLRYSVDLVSFLESKK